MQKRVSHEVYRQKTGIGQQVHLMINYEKGQGYKKSPLSVLNISVHGLTFELNNVE